MKRFFLYSGLALALGFFTTAVQAQNDRRGRQEQQKQQQQQRPMNPPGSNRIPSQPINRPPAPMQQQPRPERIPQRPSQPTVQPQRPSAPVIKPAPMSNRAVVRPSESRPISGGILSSGTNRPAQVTKPTLTSGSSKPAVFRPATSSVPSNNRPVLGGSTANKPVPSNNKSSNVFQPVNIKPTTVNSKPTSTSNGLTKPPAFNPGKISKPTLSGGGSSMPINKPGIGSTTHKPPVITPTKPGKKININVILGLGALSGTGLLGGHCPGQGLLSGPVFPGSGGIILGNTAPPIIDNGFLQGSSTDVSLSGGGVILDGGSLITLPEGSTILPGTDSGSSGSSTVGSETGNNSTAEGASEATDTQTGTLSWHHEQGSLTQLADGTWQEKLTTESSLHINTFKLMDKVGDAIYLYDAERKLTIRIQNDEVHGKQLGHGVNEFTLMYKGGWKK